MTTTPDQMCTCGHGAASAHDIHVSIPAFTACVVTGCTCKAFEQAPDAEHQPVPGEDYCRCGKILPCDDAKPAPMDPVHILGIGAEPAPRQARRDTIRYILDRLDRGLTLTENERFALRNRINAEQIDGDQAREQRDQAAASLTDLRNDLYAERRAHEEHRQQLADVLNEPEHADWLSLIARTRQIVAGRRTWKAKAAEIEVDRDCIAEQLAAARAGDAPWITAYREDLAAADKRVKRAEASADLRRQRAEQLKRSRDYWKRTAEQADADLTAVRKRLTAKLTAAQAENDGLAECLRNTDRITTAEVTELRTRAEQAEISARAHKTAATEATERAECETGDMRTCTMACPEHGEAEAPCFHPSWETYGRSRKCTDCGEWLDPQPPADPDGAALWATIRDHAARDHQFWTDLTRHHNQLYQRGIRP